MMHADPEIGILQTPPRSSSGRARSSQPAAAIRRLHLRSGDLARPRGLVPATAAITGDTTPSSACRPSPSAAKLPEDSRAARPFGGHVLSHDFVEAALIRRGGWKVRMATELRRLVGGVSPSLRRRRHPRSPLGAKEQPSAPEDHRRVGAGPREPRASRDRHHELPVLTPLWLLMLAIGFALAVRVALDPARVLQSRLPDVSEAGRASTSS